MVDEGVNVEISFVPEDGLTDEGVVVALPKILDAPTATVDEERSGFSGLSGVGLELMELAEEGLEMPEGVTLEVGALSGTAGASGALLEALPGATEEPTDGSCVGILLETEGTFVEAEAFSVGEVLDDSSVLGLPG